MLVAQCRPRIRPWLTVALAALLTVGAGSEDPGTTKQTVRRWQSGQAIPIAVKAGRARFIVPQAERSASTLIIVSSLSKMPGPFPFRLAARPTTSLNPPQLADDGPARAANLKPYVRAPVAKPAGTAPAPERTFHLLVHDGDVASASNYLAVRGVLGAFGRRVQVYVDSQDAGRVGPEVLRDVVATFDERIFPVAANTIGQARDVDGDGRFTVLVSGWLTRLAGGRHAVDGFVRGADLDPDLGAPFSNHCDMMYLSAAIGSGPHLRTVLAHEYTHAVTYSSKSFTGPSGTRTGLDEEGWLDEALAHLGEDLHGFSRSNVDYRIRAFLSRPEAYRLVVDDYYAANLFRSHGNRGGTYLFLRWCADRYGPSLLPELIRSGRRGAENLEAATGVTFASLYRQWSVALFLNGFEPTRERVEGFRPPASRHPTERGELAGPRAVTVKVSPEGASETWSAVGTSTRFLVVDGYPGSAVEVEVEGPAEAELQVTAVPLPADLPRLELNVKARTGPDGVLQLVAGIGERSGLPVQLSGLSWEPLVPAANPHLTGFRRGGLDHREIASAFGSATIPGLGSLRSRPLRAPGIEPGDGPIVVKATGLDAQGRRITAWADLDPKARHDEGGPGGWDAP